MNQRNKDELYHSEIYLGKDYSNGIKHFKYIKREMKNGRWVYYYNGDKEYRKSVNDFNKSSKKYFNEVSKNDTKNKKIRSFNEYTNKEKSLAKDYESKRKATKDAYKKNNNLVSIGVRGVAKALDTGSKIDYNAKKASKKSKKKIDEIINKYKKKKK